MQNKKLRILRKTVSYDPCSSATYPHGRPPARHLSKAPLHHAIPKVPTFAMTNNLTTGDPPFL
jgi:hypothetical protein